MNAVEDEGRWRIFWGAEPRAGDAALARLHARSFTPRARSWSAAEFAQFRSDASLRWVEAVPTGKEQNDSELAGMALSRLLFEESELLTLCRDPNWSGQGLGKRLLKRVLLDASSRGARSMFLEVAAGNRSALNLYHSLGFEQISKRPRYYRNADGVTEDALVFRTELSA